MKCISCNKEIGEHMRMCEDCASKPTTNSFSKEGESGQHDSDNTEALQRLLSAWKIRSYSPEIYPNLETFRPTMESPIVAYTMGDIGGAPVMVYGVKKYFYGLSGHGFKMHFRFDWYVDKAEAMKEAITNIYTTSEAGRDWVGEPFSKEETVTDCAQRQLSLPDGTYFTVTRVVALGRFERERKIMWRPEAIHHRLCENLWEKYKKMNNPQIKRIDGNESLEPRARFPDVTKVSYGYDPDTGAELIRYGCVCLVSGRFEYKWFADQTVAERTHDQAREVFFDMCQEEQDKQKRKDALDAYHTISHLSRNLVNTDLFKYLKGQIEGSVVDNFNTEEGREYNEIENSDAAYIIAVTEKLKNAITALKSALENKYLEKLAEAETVAMPERTRQLLNEHLPTCSLCDKKYNVELDDLVVYGIAHITCGCPKVWTVYQRDEQQQPPIVKTLFNCLYSPLDRNFFQEFQVSGGTMTERGIVLRTVTLNGAPAIRQVVIGNAYNLKPVLIINGNILADTSKTEAVVHVLNDWQETLSKWEDERYQTAEQDVRQGDAVKLTFVSDVHPRSGKQQLTARVRTNGVTTLYVVDDVSFATTNPNTSYYCRVLKAPPAAQKSDFNLIIVKPYLPCRVEPAEPVSSVRSADRREQGKKGRQSGPVSPATKTGGSVGAGRLADALKALLPGRK